MAKFYDAVGYGVTEETSPGVYEVQIVERKYYGDILRNARRYENGEHLNDNLNIENKISIVADAYAYNHFFAIRYVRWTGVLWKVSSVEVESPRLILSLGGVYNGVEA